jgi:protocatechuate 3,4-dioxygenase alpha subunit
MTLKQTPSQTVGPYFAYGLTPRQYGYPFSSLADGALAGPATEGRRIRLQGRVFDGAGEPVPDAMIELWQANAQGRYNHPADKRSDNLLDPDFKGFGRVGTDDLGSFVFATVKPGAVAEDQAPHLNLIVFMRGLLSHAYTRVYFADEAANASDAVLNSVAQERRGTLIAEAEETPAGPVYRFDIHMQGADETVFFDV